MIQNRTVSNARSLTSKRKDLDEYLRKNRETNRRLRANLRAGAIAALGGKCVRCGFGDIRALQIDHIDGDGAKDRKDRKMNQWMFYKSIAEHGGQGKYQCLCANCNQIKKIEMRELPPGRQRTEWYYTHIKR